MKELIKEIYRTMELGGFGSDYLSTIGSIGDTITEGEALAMLKDLNNAFSKSDANFIINNLNKKYNG